MRNRSGLLVKALIVVAVILVFVLIVSMQMRLNRIKEERDRLQKQVEDYEDKVDELQYRLDRQIDDEYIEEYARKKLGYYMLGDRIYYFDRKK